MYKTLTYETAVNLADIPLYRYLLAGSVATTPLFTLVNVSTAATAYYAHELLWNIYGPDEQYSDAALSIGAKKLLMYRVISSVRNLGLAYVFTGNPWYSLSFVVATNLMDGGFYSANEYLWYRYGPLMVRPARSVAALPARN